MSLPGESQERTWVRLAAIRSRREHHSIVEASDSDAAIFRLVEQRFGQEIADAPDAIRDRAYPGSMFLRESVQRCSTCDEVTPHSRRWIAVPLLVALACLVAATLCFTLGSAGALGSVGVLGGVFLLWLAVFLIHRDRERFWHVDCERCRGKRLAELRRIRPSLGDGTARGVF